MYNSSSRYHFGGNITLTVFCVLWHLVMIVTWPWRHVWRMLAFWPFESVTTSTKNLREIPLPLIVVPGLELQPFTIENQKLYECNTYFIPLLYSNQKRIVLTGISMQDWPKISWWCARCCPIYQLLQHSTALSSSNLPFCVSLPVLFQNAVGGGSI